MPRNAGESEEEIAREVAEKAKPGWKAVSVSVSSASAGAMDAAPNFDFQGLYINALKQKYLGIVKDGAKPAGAALRNDDVHFVSMVPENGADTPIRARKVVVSGRKVIGFQG